MDRGRHASFEQNTSSSMLVLKERGRSFSLPRNSKRGRDLPAYIGDGHVHVIGRRFEFNVPRLRLLEVDINRNVKRIPYLFYALAMLQYK